MKNEKSDIDKKNSKDFFINQTQNFFNDEWSDYYINQKDSSYKDITFKNKTIVGTYGCGVCSVAMIVCKKLGLKTKDDKKKVIKHVIEEVTDGKGDLSCNGTLTYNETKFSFTQQTMEKTKKALENKDSVICFLKGKNGTHFVVITTYDETKTGNEAYLIKDPGKKNNGNLKQAMDDGYENINRIHVFKIT